MRNFRKKNAKGTVKLKSFVGKRFVRGTVIEVRVTKPGSIGAVKRLKIRGRGRPDDGDELPSAGLEDPVALLNVANRM